MKDHYKTLGIPFNASLQEIKKAYRKLAHQYHPDKNPDNPFTNTHFSEIQSAYSILADERSRKHYDEERYFAGLTAQKEPSSITPSWILVQAKKLSMHMEHVDAYRMNHKTLHDYVALLLSDSHLAVLKHEHEAAVNLQIIDEILKALKNIHYRYYSSLSQRLSLLAGTDNEMHLMIFKAERERRRQGLIEKYFPFIILGLTLFLCLLMYWYSKR